MLTYATVKEYNRFIEELPDITHISGDLKNFQRPWVVDAVIGYIFSVAAGPLQVENILGRRYDEYPYRKVTSLNLIARNS